MNAKERYNSIVEQIENLCEDRELKPADIAETVAQSQGMALRDLNAVISFMTEQPTIAYIRDRKMMAAYNYLTSEEKPIIMKAVEISGYDNQSSFSKRFKAEFGISPKKAAELKSRELLKQVPDWDAVSSEKPYLPYEAEEETEMAEAKIYGITQEQYSIITQIEDLRELYGLPQMYGQVAYELYTEQGIPLKKAFEFVDSLYHGEKNEEDELISEKPAEEPIIDKELEEIFENLKAKRSTEEDEDEDFELTPEEILRDEAFDPYIQYMYFEKGITAGTAYQAREKIPLDTEEIMKLDWECIVRFCAYSREICFDYFKRAYDYYKEHADETYDELNKDEYFEDVLSNIPYEEAFSAIIPFNYKDFEDLCPNVNLEQLMKEDRDWLEVEATYEEENAYNDRRPLYDDDEENIFFDMMDHGDFS